MDEYPKENMEIIVLEITEWGDGLKEKGDAVNICLRELCIEKNIWLLEHKNFVAAEHLNRRKVNLNGKGSSILASNSINLLKSLWLVNMKISLRM